MRISVVIPSYNHARYLEEALDSVLAAPAAETYGDAMEVVVVDDGSVDESPDLLRRRAEQDPRLVAIFQENRGAHAALNRGVEAARGEIVFPLNSDDAFHAERIPRCLRVFDEDPEATLVASWIEIIDGDGATLGVKEGWRNMPPWSRRRRGASFSDLGDPLLTLLEANWISTTSNVAFRRRDFNADVCFHDLRYTHDWDFFLAMGTTGNSRGTHGLREIREPLVRYRVHGENTIREGRDADRARGQMRFEILWSIARHARRVVGEDEDLGRRLWNSLPEWTPGPTFSQLIELRGAAGSPPPAYDDLLREGHPLREVMIERMI